MAQSGYTPILIYASGTTGNAPVAANLTSSSSGAELALNYFDGKLYYKDASGNVQVLATKGAAQNSISFGTTGLTPSTATQGAVTVAGTLITSNGGTGLSSWTAGDLPYYASGTALSKLGIGTNGYILTSNGTAPVWTAGSSISVNTATNLAGGAAGSVPYQSGAGATTFLSIGTANTVMTSSGTAPQWSSSLTLGGNLVVNGNTTLGDAAADTVTINGTITSNLIFTDNTYDIGASGATRPRSLFLGTNLTVGALGSFGGNVAIGGTATAWTSAYALSVSNYTSFGQRNISTADAVMSWNAKFQGGTSGTGYTYLVTGDVAASYEMGGSHRWYTTTVAGTAGGAITFGAPKMQLANAGYLYLGNVSAALANINMLTGGQGGGVQLIRNTTGSPTSGQSLGSVAWKGLDSANSNAAAEAMIEAVAAENQSGSTAATDLLFYTKPSGTGPGSSPVERVRLYSTGLLQVYGSEFIGVTTTGGMSAQTGLTVVGGSSVSDNTPGVITIGTHYNSPTSGDTIGQLNFYSNDASSGAAGVQASVRAITSSALGDAASLAFYTKYDAGTSLAIVGSATYAGQWQFGGSTLSVDGNARLTLWGAAGQNNGISLYETSTGNNARLRIYQAAANVYYDATYSAGGNNHNFQIGSGNVAQISSLGLYVGNGSVSPWFTSGIVQGPSFSISQIAGVDQTAWATGLYQSTYTGNWLSRGAYRASMYQQLSGGHAFFVNVSTPTGAGQTLNLAQRLTIDSGGFTSIGVNSTPNYQLEVFGQDGSANRTSPFDVVGVSAISGNAPYNGFGAGLVFKSSNYVNSTPIVGGRIRNKINDDSISTAGSGLAFDVTLTRGGALYQGMELTYAGQLLVGTTSNPTGTSIISSRGYSSTGNSSLIQTRTGNYNGLVTNLVLFTRGNSSAQGWAYVTIDTIYGTPTNFASRTVVMVRGDMTYTVISQTGDGGSSGYGAISFSVSGNDFRVSNANSNIYFSIQCELGSPNYTGGFGWDATFGGSW